MSNKYEREIEEILRKIDDGRPPSVTERLKALNQRPTPIRPRRAGLTLRPETGLVAGFVIAFLAEIARWILQPTGGLANLVIGIAVLVGFALIALTFILSWVNGNRGPAAGWRGTNLGPGGREPNRDPFSSLRSRWNLLRLRLGYRRHLR